MTTVILAIHIIICLLLIGIILIQAGRGGGLVESFSGVESMFGPKTNNFLTRATTILSTLFFITCLTLAFLAAKQSKSLMPTNVKTQTKAPETETVKTESKEGANQPEAPKSAESPKEESAKTK